MRGKGQGSIYIRESDGLYCSALELPSINGKRRRAVVTVNPHYPKELTDKQARAALIVKLNKLKEAKERNGDLPTAGQTLESWLNLWFESIASKKVRPKTAATYRTLLEQYIVPAIGKTRLNQLTPAHVRRVETYITDTLGLSSTTAAQAYRVLSVALRYAEREGRVTLNVATRTDAPQRAVRTLNVLTTAHARQVLATVANDRLGSRWAAAILTGARQGELLGLELDRVTDVLDLSWQLQRLGWRHGCKTPCGAARPSECPERTINAPASWEHRYLTGGLWLSRPKSDAGTRIVPLVDPLREIIRRRIEAAAGEPNPFGLLWTSEPKSGRNGRSVAGLDGSPIDPRTDNRAWHAVLSRAGVPDVRLHDARHTAGSLFLEAHIAEPVTMRILGHNSYVVTRGYQNVDRLQLDDAMTRVSEKFVLPPADALPPSTELVEPAEAS